MELRLTHCTVARNSGVWIQQCVVQNASACCITSSGSCCDGEQFTWKPGYLIAVLNGDGTDRLGPYVDVNGSTQIPTATPTPSSLLQSTTQPPILITSISISGGVATSNLTSPTLPPTQKGDASAKSAGLITGVVLGFILFASTMGLAALVIKYKKERRKTEELEAKAAELEVKAAELEVKAMELEVKDAELEVRGAELLGYPLPLRPPLTPQELAGTTV